MKKTLTAVLSVILIFTFIGGFYCIENSGAKAAVSADIKLSVNYIGLEAGQKRTLLAYVRTSAPEYTVNWTSSDTSVAVVTSDGVVTAVSEGTATVTAEYAEENISAECTVRVLSGHINGKFDFSESNMITNSSFEDPYGTAFTVDDGGNTSMALAYLTRWDGAVLEENDRFPLSRNPDDLVYQETEADYHLTEAIFIPNRKSYLDNDRIKEAIIEYGAVYASFAVNNKCFNDNSGTYYRPEYLNPVDGGHAIAIVGWDDNYSRYNFEYTPDGDGAFICKNSWGTSSGENGYVYISYYDGSIGKRDVMTAYTGLETASPYNKIYQYDPYGFIDTLYGTNENTIYAANVFPENSSKISADEKLTAVSFYTYSENTEYEIYAVPDYEGTSSFVNGKISLKSGVLKETGYYTIDFEPVSLSAGTRFAVIVKLKTSEGESRFCAEAPVKDYSEGAGAGRGESFYAFDGDDWTDLTDDFENYNFCIKAFTKTNENYNGLVLSGINNYSRDYESDKIYTVNEIAERTNSDINPEFVDYINGLDNGLSKSASADKIYSSVPSPFLISSSSEADFSCKLPSRFNLYDEKCLTPVKNQGDINGCWAFATYASLESCLLRKASSLTEISDGMTVTDEIDAIIRASNIKLEKISLNLTENEVLVTDEFSLKAKAYPLNAKLRDVKWSSSDPTIATVNSHGFVIARKPGTVKIFAKNGDESVTAYCDLTVKPRLFCITWNVNNKLSTQLVYEFSAIKPTITPEKTGYSFVGWEPELPDTMPSENISFTAKWTVNKYSSLFDAAGGFWDGGYTTQTVRTDYGKKISLPANPVRPGYDFSGWDADIPSAMPASDLTFNAVWIARNDTEYKVKTYTMNSDGSYRVSSETKQGTTDESINILPPKTDNGFYFNNDKSILSGKINGDGSLVLSVYIDRQSYTLKTISDGVEMMYEYHYGQTVPQPQIPYKEGYYFIGWSPEVPSEMPAGDLTLHAVFERIYSVTIKNNPGTKKVNYGDTLVLTAVADEIPEKTVITWHISGSGFNAKVSDDGKYCYLTSVKSGTAEVSVYIEYENGESYLNPNGKEVFASQKITSDAGFFQIIISFFKNLFRIDRYVLQNIVNNIR